MVARCEGTNMAGRGMGCAVKGGGAVGKGPKNKMISEPSMKTGKVLMMAEAATSISTSVWLWA